MYAVWKEDSYTVKYNANGAAGEEILQYGKPGCGIRLIENTYVRSGYKFSGWATTKDGIVLYKNAQEILTDLAEKIRQLYCMRYGRIRIGLQLSLTQMAEVAQCQIR